jgi:acyl-CoA reductase-like NAD-dependent aldehyde dehydrogenase
VKLIQNYIDGRFVSGKREFADVNPADGTVIAQVSEAGEKQVDEAAHAARHALRGEWGRLGVRERAARLHKVADAI